MSAACGEAFPAPAADGHHRPLRASRQFGDTKFTGVLLLTKVGSPPLLGACGQCTYCPWDMMTNFLAPHVPPHPSLFVPRLLGRRPPEYPARKCQRLHSLPLISHLSTSNTPEMQISATRPGKPRFSLYCPLYCHRADQHFYITTFLQPTTCPSLLRCNSGHLSQFSSYPPFFVTIPPARNGLHK